MRLFFGMFLMLAAEGRFSKPNENNQGNKCYRRNEEDLVSTNNKALSGDLSGKI